MHFVSPPHTLASTLTLDTVTALTMPQKTIYAAMSAVNTVACLDVCVRNCNEFDAMLTAEPAENSCSTRRYPSESVYNQTSDLSIMYVIEGSAQAE
jgi:hypothetical protein